MNRLITWLVFIVAISVVAMLHACNNVTPLRMAERGYCWDNTQLTYAPCKGAR